MVLPNHQQLLSRRILCTLLLFSTALRSATAFYPSFGRFHSTPLARNCLLSDSKTVKPRSAHHNPSNDDMFWPQQQKSSSSAAEDNESNIISQDDEENEVSTALDSIVKVHCTHTEPDYLIPWQRTHQSTSTSSGFCISLLPSSSAHDNDNDTSRYRVMTNAHSVEYGSLVQVQRRGEERKYEAVVEVFCNECDLAILRIEDKDFWHEELKPLEFGPLPSLQDDVEVLGYPTGGDSLSITQGVVSRIEMQEYSQASSHLLAIQIDAAINPGNSGGPVVNEDMQVIGVAFQGLEGAENIGYVVPVTVVQHVLHDIQRHGRYSGFCSLGVGLSFLENRAFRKSLGMLDGRDVSGVMVKDVLPTAEASGTILPNDVVYEVDGISVDNDGKIPFRRGERVALACYIQTKFLGDTVKLNILREGKEMELEVPVSITNKLVPAHWVNQPPPYMVVAGLVFTALSVPYLHASSAWDSWVSDAISYLVGKWHESAENKTDQVVVLAQVLAHRENLGYDKLNDLHLQKLNGKKVCSLRQLKTLIEECEDEFLRFEFAPNNQIVVMEYANMNAVTDQICNEHSIQKRCVLHHVEAAEVVQDASPNGAVREPSSVNGSGF